MTFDGNSGIAEEVIAWICDALRLAKKVVFIPAEIHQAASLYYPCSIMCIISIAVEFLFEVTWQDCPQPKPLVWFSRRMAQTTWFGPRMFFLRVILVRTITIYLGVLSPQIHSIFGPVEWDFSWNKTVMMHLFPTEIQENQILIHRK